MVVQLVLLTQFSVIILYIDLEYFLKCYFGPIPKFPVANYHYNGMQAQHPQQ